nr:AAA family ATPase [Sphingomonas populi]
MTRTLQHDDFGADAGIYEETPPEAFELADLTLWARTAPTPKAFVMAPYIPRDDVVIITGDGGTNKSTLALQISACAAAGKQMLGMDVVPSPALYITAEDDQRENHWRIAKIAHAIGTTLDDLSGRLHIASLRGRLNNELATFEGDGKMRPAPAYRMLRETIRQTGAKLVTLDNVAHLFAGNENDRSNVTAFINLLYQLCGDLAVTILLIAHRNKAGDAYSGSTAWLNAVRSQVLMERADEDPDVRRMSLGKANYARAGEDITFRWHDFALVRDADLTPGMAQQIAEITAANAANARFLKCLAAVTARRETAGHIKGTNYAPRKFAGMAEAEGMKEKQFEKAMERLLHLGQIRANQQLWQDGNRHWKHGLKLASECVDPPAATPRDDLRAPPTQDIENTAQTPRAATPPYINIPGAGLEASAPGNGRSPIDFSAFEKPWASRAADEPDDVEF